MPIVNFERYCEMLDKAHAGQYAYPAINISNTDKVKKSTTKSKSENYHALSKLDVKVLLREINLNLIMKI